MEALRIFWGNLTLLGFDAAAESRRHSVEIEEHTFQQRSSKAVEVVLHFLLNKLNPELAAKEFRTCWPVFNDKSRMREFKTKVFAMLVELQSSGAIPSNTFRKSTMEDCGERLYHPLCVLSSHVLEAAFAQEFPENCSASSLRLEPRHVPHAGVLLRAAKVKIAVQSEKFVQKSQQLHDARGRRRVAASQLTERCRYLLEQKRRFQHEERMLHAQADETIYDERAAVQRSQMLERSSELWHQLSQIRGQSETNTGVIEDISEHPQPRYRLLEEELPEASGGANCLPRASDGTVALSTIVRRWNGYLDTMSKTIGEHLKDGNASSSSIFHVPAEQHEHTLDTQEGYLTELSRITNELLSSSSEVKASIKELQGTVLQCEEQLATRPSAPEQQLKPAQSAMGLQPPTPSPYVTMIATSPFTPTLTPSQSTPQSTPGPARAAFAKHLSECRDSVQKQVRQQWDEHNTATSLTTQEVPRLDLKPKLQPKPKPAAQHVLKPWKAQEINRLPAQKQPTKHSDPILDSIADEIVSVSLGKKSTGTLLCDDPLAAMDGASAFSTRPKLQFTPPRN